MAWSVGLVDFAVAVSGLDGQCQHGIARAVESRRVIKARVEPERASSDSEDERGVYEEISRWIRRH
jgi:RNA-binding protein YhbY